MKISIIIPVYNVEQYLSQCLDSVITQTYDNIEIIIVNDGSTDNSQKIISKYSDFDKRIRSIYQKNGGLSQARNAGLNIATGDYILFLDSDDYISIDTCETLAHCLTKQCADLVVFGRYRFSDNEYIHDKVSVNQSHFPIGIQYLEHAVLNNCFTASVCNKLFKKELIDKYIIRFIPNILYEDLFFVFRYIIYSKQVNTINTALYNYRWIREDSIINTVKDKDKDVLITIDEIEKFLRENRKEEILHSYYFNELIYTWIANAVVFKYPMKYLHSKKANDIVKFIINDKRFNKYVKYMINSKEANLKWKLTAWSSIKAYPIFALMINIYGKIKKYNK